MLSCKVCVDLPRKNLGAPINFHRKYDIILVRNFERILPKWLIEKIYSPYQWTADPKQTYRKHLKAIQ